MASLEALTRSYRIKKAEVAKLRRKGENDLKAALSLKRRSSHGLASLQRKKEELERNLSHVSQLLNQYNSQKESIARLKVDAEERLKHEMDEQDNIKQQIDFGPSEEKSSLQERLRSVDEKIAELHDATKEREGAETRLERQIGDLQKEKTRLESRIRSQGHAKPALVQQLRSSEKAEPVLRTKVQSLIKREEHASKALKSVEKKLADVMAQRRKAKHTAGRKRRNPVKRRTARKATRKARTRTSRKKQPRRAKKRAATRTRAVQKRHVARRQVAKRKTAKRKSRAKARRR